MRLGWTMLLKSKELNLTVPSTRSPRAQELCESRGGRPGLPVPKSPYGLCGRKATLNSARVRAQELV